MTKHVDTKTIIDALEILADEVQCADGAANAALWQAAEHMRELHENVRRLRAMAKSMDETNSWLLSENNRLKSDLKLLDRSEIEAMRSTIERLTNLIEGNNENKF